MSRREDYDISNDEGQDQAGRGFASMDKDRLREIAAKGGRHSHGGKHKRHDYGGDDESESDDYNRGGRKHNKQGFASMPKDQVREIASKGGKSRGGHDDDDDNQGSGRKHGKQGFASMPKDQVREIASKGGKSSHGRKQRGRDTSDHDEGSDDNQGSGRKHGKQGFASMPKDQVREIASMGGRSSHGGRKRQDYDDDQGSDEDSDNDQGSSRKHGKQGFASMPKDQVRKIASKGGKAKGGHYDQEEDSDEESDEGSDNEDQGGYRSGKQGFASMPKEQVRKIAAKGGRHGHGGGRKRKRGGYDESESESSEDEDQGNGNYRRSGKQGFASMPKDKVYEIGHKGAEARWGLEERSNTRMRIY